MTIDQAIQNLLKLAEEQNDNNLRIVLLSFMGARRMDMDGEYAIDVKGLSKKYLEIAQTRLKEIQN